MLGTQIAKLRRRAGLSQHQLADILGVSPSAVGMYEQGRREPAADKLVVLADYFNVSLEYLLTGRPSNLNDPAALGVWYRQLEQIANGAALRGPDGNTGPLTQEVLATFLAALNADKD